MPSNEPSSVIAPGSKVIAGSECYEIVAELGRGGMGVVYQAVQTSIQRTVALKMLTTPTMEDSQALQRFLREGRLCSSLNHPNVVKVFGISTADNGPPFMVMEFLQGRTLADILKEQKTLDEKTFVKVFDQVLSALHCAHEKGLIHRDIKPSNIMVTRDGTIKIMDFGIAKSNVIDSSHQGLTRTGAIVGSPWYMSPEQCSSLPLDARTDLYSVGCIMYESLVGQHPYSGDNPLEVMYKHVNEQLNTADIPIPLFSDLIRRALAKQPDQRHNSAEEMRNELHEAPAVRPHTLKGQRTRTKVHGRKITILLMATLALGAGCAYFLSRTDTNQEQETYSARELFTMGTEAVEKLYITPSSQHAELSRQALDYLERAAKQAHKDNNSTLEAEALGQQAQFKPREFANEALHKKMLSLYEKDNSRTLGHAMCLLSLGQWYYDRDRHKEALAYSTKALAMLQTLRSGDVVQSHIRNANRLCGLLYHRLKIPAEANRCFELATNGAKTNIEAETKALILNKTIYAKCLRNQGQYQESNVQIEQIIDLYKLCDRQRQVEFQPESDPTLQRERDDQRKRTNASDAKEVANLNELHVLNTRDLTALQKSPAPK